MISLVDSFDSWLRSLLVGLDAMDPSTIVEANWRTPPLEIFKVNFDATNGSKEVDLGVVRDSNDEN